MGSRTARRGNVPSLTVQRQQREDEVMAAGAAGGCTTNVQLDGGSYAALLMLPLGATRVAEPKQPVVYRYLLYPYDQFMETEYTETVQGDGLEYDAAPVVTMI